MKKTHYLPIYMQIVENIKKQLASGKLKPGTIIPGEIELAKNFNVARPTLRKALEVLEREGFIIRKKSAGTKIAPRSMHNKHLHADIACVSPMYGSPEHSLDVLLYPCLTSKVIKALSSKGNLLRIIPWNTGNHYYTVEDIVLRKRIDGFMIFGPGSVRDFVEMVAKSKMPHVAFESHLDFPGVNTLMLDDISAAYSCVERLYKNGFRKIGFLGGVLKRPELNSASRRRFDGFVKACKDFGIEMKPKWVKNFLPDISYNVDDNDFTAKAAVELLTGKDKPEAVVLSSFKGASHFLKIAEEYNIRIPDDISVITISGSCNERLIENIEEIKKLSGYFYSEDKFAQKGVELLQEWLTTPTFRPRCRLMKFDFIEGNSIKNHK